MKSDCKIFEQLCRRILSQTAAQIDAWKGCAAIRDLWKATFTFFVFELKTAKGDERNDEVCLFPRVADLRIGRRCN